MNVQHYLHLVRTIRPIRHL